MGTRVGVEWELNGSGSEMGRNEEETGWNRGGRELERREKEVETRVENGSENRVENGAVTRRAIEMKTELKTVKTG